MIYLIRHSIAAAPGPHGDAERPLTAEGRARFEAHVRAFRSELVVSRTLTSPFLRARETAEILTRLLGAPAAEVRAELAAGASSGETILAMAAQEGSGTAIVGHNPEVQEAIYFSSSKVDPISPGSIAALGTDDGGRFKIAWIKGF